VRPVDAVVGALAAHRLTRLAIQDVITAKPRNAILKKYPPTQESWSYLLTCPWCAGMWAGLVVAALQGLGGKAGRGLVYALALSDAVGIAEERL
jgi:hypothetical protein